MIAYLDCSTGISGDKFLGALLDAGLAEDGLRHAIAAAGVDPSRLTIRRVVNKGIAAVALDVVTSGDRGPRHWREIRQALSASSLPETVRSRALAAFTLLAEAEARVHGVSVDEVHFHEIGAADTIVDIVGVAHGLEALGIDQLVVSPVAVGSGTVSTAHGILPVPAPATAEILTGVPVVPGTDEAELTTPTGACLVRALADRFGPIPPMTPQVIGRGAGSRELSAPNIATLFLGESPARHEEHGELVAVLESNIDHLTPEQLAFVAGELLRDGALDVWQTPIIMKKGRSAVALSVMADPADGKRLADAVLRLTGTLGVRVTETHRTIAERSVVTLETSLGEVRFKISRAGDVTRHRPELDDCATIARRTGLPIDVVMRRLVAEAEARTAPEDRT